MFYYSIREANSAMSVLTICPGCQAKLSVPNEHIGQSARCPLCETVHIVANSAELAPDQPTTAASPDEANADSPAVALDAEVIEHRPAAVDNSRWYLRTPEGQMFGPRSTFEIHQWVAAGRVTSDCDLRRDQDEQWQPVDFYYPVLSWTTAQVHVAQSAIRRTPEYHSNSSSTASQQSAYPPAAYVSPHRARLILTLGIVGFPLFCPVFSVMAWVMGTNDLNEIQHGRMDSRGLELTHAGRILGMVYTIVWIPLAVALSYYVLSRVFHVF